jgi:hypothetical protein
VVQTIEGMNAGLCYQDEWASSWIQVGCASKGDQRALMFQQFALSEGGCTGTPVLKVREYERIQSMIVGV